MSRHGEHPYISTLKQQLQDGKATRREYLWTATMLGVSAGAAYAFVNKVVPGELVGSARAASNVGGSLRIGMPVDEVTRPFAIDSTQRSNLTRQVLDFLTKTGSDNVTRPSLLSGWTPDDDLRSWTLSLRKDVVFHSGRKFTADELIWNLQFALDEKNGSSTIGLFTGTLLEQYEEAGKKHTRLWDANAIEKVDDYTVRLNLKNPQLAIPEILFHYGLPMMDPDGNGLFAPGANGTGPFELVEFLPRRKAVYKARKDYWGDGPFLDTFEFVDLGDDPNAAIGALAAGQIDGIYEADTAQFEALKRLPDLTFYKASTGATGLIRGKVSMKPWDDVRVRNALRRASNPEAALAVALQGLGDPGEHHHVAPVHPEYAKLPPYQRDVGEAKRLLAEAGYPDGLDLELNVPAQYGYLVKMAEASVEHWREAGIRVTLKLLPASQYAEAWSKAPFSVTRWSHRPLGTMALALSYTSDAPWNDSEFKNSKFDQTLRMAQATADVEKRREYMAVIEQIMQDEGPVVQPIWKAIFTFMHKRVANFKMHPTLYVFANELSVES